MSWKEAAARTRKCRVSAPFRAVGTDVLVNQGLNAVDDGDDAAVGGAGDDDG